jgi:hypothetical protein
MLCVILLSSLIIEKKGVKWKRKSEKRKGKEKGIRQTETETETERRIGAKAKHKVEARSRSTFNRAYQSSFFSQLHPTGQPARN